MNRSKKIFEFLSMNRPNVLILKKKIELKKKLMCVSEATFLSQKNVSGGIAE